MKKIISVLVALSMSAAGPVPFAYAQDSRSGMLGASEPGAQQFSQQELDQMLAPIALYPDSLLSQILMAATYPLEVVQAARWSRGNPSLRGEEAVRAVEQQEWDPSVKSLTAFPQVLAMMDEKVSWTERLGNAFLSQQEQVSATVQDLRQKAYSAGNLASNDQFRVERQDNDIIVEPANPQAMYVPYYDPNVVYGGWWYPTYPPVSWAPPPGYYAPPGRYAGFFIGPAIIIGAAFFFGAFDWHRRQVHIVNTRPFYYRNVGPSRVYGPGAWQHDPLHRRGIGYRDEVVRQRYSNPARPPGNDRRGFEPNRTPNNAPGSSRERSNFAPGNNQRSTQNVPNVPQSVAPNNPQRNAPNAQHNYNPNSPRPVAPVTSPPAQVRPTPPASVTPPPRATTPAAPPAPGPAAPTDRRGNDKSHERRDNPQEKDGNRDRRGSNDRYSAPVQVASQGNYTRNAPANYSTQQNAQHASGYSPMRPSISVHTAQSFNGGGHYGTRH